MEEKEFEFAKDLWLQDSYNRLEFSGTYKGIPYAVRHNLKYCYRFAEVICDIEPKLVYLHPENVYLNIRNYNNRYARNEVRPSFVTIKDEYYDNPDPELIYGLENVGLLYMNNIYRPYDQKHIGTAEYYEKLAMEFIDQYCQN